MFGTRRAVSLGYSASCSAGYEKAMGDERVQSLDMSLNQQSGSQELNGYPLDVILVRIFFFRGSATVVSIECVES